MIALSTLTALLALAWPPPAAVVRLNDAVIEALAEPGTPAGAVAVALTAPGARAEVGEPKITSGALSGGQPCHPARWSALRPVAASGQAALRFTGATEAGTPCVGYAWAPVRVLAPAATASRAVRAGEPLEGAVQVSELEVRPGQRPVADLPPGAVAVRDLKAGTPIDESALRVGPAPGSPVAVLVRAGALTIEQPGRAIPCPRGLACALLPSGRRVEGRMAGGRLLVEIP